MTFKDFSLSPAIQKALDVLGFTTPTDIQARAIPVLLEAERIDLHGQAQTGTGKTLAFGIPLLQKIDPSKKAVQALIVAPTRELVVQITDSLKAAAKFMPVTIDSIYGGVSMQDQMGALRRGVHIVVGTPGRLNDHLRRKTLSLKELQILVLDEADIMLDMGFKEEVDEILKMASPNRQIWLFSATVKTGIDEIMRNHMKNTVSVRVSPKEVAAGSKTKQYYSIVPSRFKMEALCRFIDSASEFYGFIFCPTKILTSEIAEQLSRRGYKVNALHGDLSQVQRNRIIKKFKERDFSILVATDVAARGIDIADLTHVINYSLPDDIESYVHRIGRTGRAGKEGIAITIISSSEQRKLQFIERKFKMDIRSLEVPSGEAIARVRAQTAKEYLNALLALGDGAHVYKKHLEEMLATYSEADFKKVIVSLLHDKFFQGVSADNAIPSASSGESHTEATELFVGLGQDAGATKHSLIDLLVGTGKITKEQIQRIKILQGHSFIVVPSEVAEDLMEALHLSQDGKRLRVSLTGQNPFEHSGPRGGSDRRGSGGDRSRGGFSRHRRGGGGRYERRAH